MILHKISSILLSAVFVFIGVMTLTSTASAATTTNCQPKSSVIGLPTWYKYLDGKLEQPGPNTSPAADAPCQVVLNGLTDIWKIVAALLEGLLRIASLVAIGFVVVGGITYMTSQGSPDKTKQAQSTVISAIAGLVIAISAAAIVSYIAGRIN